MFTLKLLYPEDSRGRRESREIRSGDIPQIGSSINCDKHYGSYRVAEVGRSITDGTLDDTVYVDLENEE